MRKIIFMGAVGCGKTTLCQRIIGNTIEYQKTQAISFYPEMIDTPGEFILHRKYYSALTVTAADAEIIGLVQSVKEQEQIFSPGFGSIFPKKIIGIITKSDLAESEAQLKRIEKELRQAGAKETFRVSAVENTGVEALIHYLNTEGKD